jgi:hypothetical protein
VKPEALTYLLNQMDNSETSHLIKLAAQSQQAQLAIEDLPLPGAAAASSSQTPNPIPAGLTPRLPDGSTLKSNELKPVNSVGLRQVSPSPEIPPPPPWAGMLPMRGKERPSVSVSREIAKHTAGAIKGDITLPEAKSRSLQARTNAIVERQVRRERSRPRFPPPPPPYPPPDEDMTPVLEPETKKVKKSKSVPPPPFRGRSPRPPSYPPPPPFKGSSPRPPSYPPAPPPFKGSSPRPPSYPPPK